MTFFINLNKLMKKLFIAISLRLAHLFGDNLIPLRIDEPCTVGTSRVVARLLALWSRSYFKKVYTILHY